MAFVTDSAFDAALDYLSANATAIHVCSSEPADRAGAIAASLADGALGAGDFTKGAGSPDGRKTTVAAQNGLTVDASGTATHVAIISGTELLLTTALSASQSVTSGNTVNVAAFDYTIRDAT